MTKKKQAPLSLALSLSLPFALCLSLLHHSLLEPGGQGRNVFGATQELFVLGAEVPKAVNLERQRVSGLRELLAHHHCQTD